MISSNVDYSEFRGLSVDTKPTAENGATFFEMDTNKTYMYDKENAQWREIEIGGSSSELPSVTAEDDGDVLTVVSGAWAKATPSGGGGGVLAIGFSDENTLDKTWKEIHDAVSDGKLPFVIFVGEDEIGTGLVMSVYEESGYCIDIMFSEMLTFSAETENGYPTSASDDGGGGDGGGGDVPT